MEEQRRRRRSPWTRASREAWQRRLIDRKGGEQAEKWTKCRRRVLQVTITLNSERQGLKEVLEVLFSLDFNM